MKKIFTATLIVINFVAQGQLQAISTWLEFEHNTPETRLINATYVGAIPRMQAALDDGADVNALIEVKEYRAPGDSTFITRTPLQWAVEMAPGSLEEAVKLLLLYGADPNLVDEDNRSALTMVTRNKIYNGLNTTIQDLLEAHANPNHITKIGYTPLINTIDEGNTYGSLLLLLYGANPSIKTNLPDHRNTAYKQAILNKDKTMVVVLNNLGPTQSEVQSLTDALQYLHDKYPFAFNRDIRSKITSFWRNDIVNQKMKNVRKSLGARCLADNEKELLRIILNKNISKIDPKLVEEKLDTQPMDLIEDNNEDENLGLELMAPWI